MPTPAVKAVPVRSYSVILQSTIRQVANAFGKEAANQEILKLQRIVSDIARGGRNE